jgi:hypothetical protein
MPVAAISVLWMLFMGIVFLFPTLPRTDVSGMNYTVVVLGGILLLSIIWYYFPKYGGVHWFTGPVSNIGTQEWDGHSTATDSKRGKEGIEMRQDVELVDEKSG